MTRPRPQAAGDEAAFEFALFPGRHLVPLAVLGERLGVALQVLVRLLLVVGQHLDGERRDEDAGQDKVG